MKDYRVGLGFDVHRFSRKKKDLVLGGVKIPFSKGLEAVSDGDVILHAVTDALCGATSLGDIGDYFPPQSKESKGIDSKKIVKFIFKRIVDRFKIINIDVTVIADKPALVSYKREIVKSLENIFCISGVNLKIKSKEGLNILGGSNAISCLATVLVSEIG
ncbi:MAG: 2-C-methyl-D-erythritol 2,4-cyclodiphosphate synthase [Candidatus Omnitrophota bacterium]|nr:MAG: 2-C-methyl-D-erythritol 2,4-cyclodiphosphate synthase [Candidatus Omnitrophota bacterium]